MSKPPSNPNWFAEAKRVERIERPTMEAAKVPDGRVRVEMNFARLGAMAILLVDTIEESTDGWNKLEVIATVLLVLASLARESAVPLADLQGMLEQIYLQAGGTG